MSTIAESGRSRGSNRAHKSSGIEWLGDVPQHWDLLRLKYCADLVNEKVNGAACELPYTGLEHIESWTGRRLVTDTATSSDGQASLHRAGDVLFGKLRPYLAKAYVAEDDGICTSELLVLRPKVVLERFLRDYILSSCFISVVDSSTYGAKMPRASWDFIGSLPVLVPPIDEQRAIAVFLDRETSRIDALIEKVDVVLVLSIDGRKHLEQAKPVFAAGKPVFIDKPIAGSLADAVRIFQLAKEHRVPCFSSSSLRFAKRTIDIRDDPHLGDVVGCDQYSPCSLEPHHPDFFWYGVHGVEPLFTIMGTGCRSVTRVHTEGTDVAVGVWSDGRIGTFRGIRAGRRSAAGRRGTT